MDKREPSGRDLSRDKPQAQPAYRKNHGKTHSNADAMSDLPILEIAVVLVCLIHVASVIVNADHGIM